MDQITLGLDPLTKKTRKEVFLEEMSQVVPWGALVALIQPHARGAHQALGGRPPFAVETMLRIHCLQLWRNLSDPTMEEELHERPLYRRFVGLDGAARLPDETTILRFRHLLEKHELAPQVLAAINATLAQQGLMLKTGTVVDATIIAAPSSTKNKDGERDPEMHQTKKGNQWHFGMKAHIGVDAESGLVHTVVGTAANVNDVTQAAASCCMARRPMPGAMRATRAWTSARSSRTARCAGKSPCGRASAAPLIPSASCISCWRRRRSSRPASVPRSSTHSASSNSSLATPRSGIAGWPRTPRD